MSLARHELDSLQHVGERRLADEVVEVHPHPAGLDAFAAGVDRRVEALAARQVDAQQPVPVGAGAGAAAPRLDAEEIVEQGHDEVVVQQPFVAADDERHDRQPRRLQVPQHVQVGVRRPGGDGAFDVGALELLDVRRADRLLQAEHEPGADRLDDRRRAALLAVGGIGQVGVAGGADVRHRAAARHRGDRVRQQAALDHQHAGGARPADELVRRDEHRVLRRLAPLVRPAGIHLDAHVGRRRREVPEGQRPVGVQQPRNGGRVRDDARHVAGGREAADPQRTSRVPRQLAGQMLPIDAAVLVLGDGHDVGDGLAPGQLVRVVLVGADEDDRPLVGRDVRRQPVPLVQVARQPQVEDVDQPVDGAGGARAAEDHDVLGRAADGGVDQAAGILAEARRLQAGARGLGVRVRVERQHLLAQEVLDEGERAPARRVVRVGQAPHPVGPVQRAVVADDRLADPLQHPVDGRPVQGLAPGHGSSRCTVAGAKAGRHTAT